MKIKKAFTLAEVLVTLMIIGVIASMTIPGLKRNADDRTTATNLKKIYGELNNATRLAMTEYSATRFCRTGLTDDEQTFEDDFVKKYFNVMTVCPAGEPKDCFGDNKLARQGYDRSKSYLLTNGMAILFEGSVYPYCTKGFYSNILIDVNGPKKPNKGGSDVFMLTINHNGGEVYATGFNPTNPNKSGNQISKETCEDATDDYTASWACAAQIQKDGWQIKY